MPFIPVMAVRLLGAFRQLSISPQAYHTASASVHVRNATHQSTVSLAENSPAWFYPAVECKLRCATKCLTTSIGTHYDLPGSFGSVIHKQSILDPVSFKQYELPTNLSEAHEKLSPPFIDITPKEDPHHLQRVIDTGVCIDMYSDKWMMKLRDRMHKRRRRERRVERDHFLLLRREHAKEKKKEAKTRLLEQEWAEKADAFDAEKLYDAKMKESIEQGWKANNILDELKAIQRTKAE